MNKILVINPGSTSTKIAVYQDEQQILLEVIRHSAEEIGRYEKIADQYEFRKDLIISKVQEKGIETNDFDAIIGRGGMVRPLESGVYAVNQAMLDDLRNCRYSAEHASNLGGVIAYEMANTIGCPAYSFTMFGKLAASSVDAPKTIAFSTPVYAPATYLSTNAANPFCTCATVAIIISFV